VLPTDDFQGDHDPTLIRESVVWNRVAEPLDDRGSAWLRGGAVLRYQRGPWSAQLDAFTRVSFERKLEAYYYETGQRPIGNLGLGVGRELGPLHATVELAVGEIPLSESETLLDWDELTKQMISTALISLGGRRGALEWRGHAGIPLDRYARDHTVLLGVDVTYRR
jgi:hypothetical protein